MIKYIKCSWAKADETLLEENDYSSTPRGTRWLFEHMQIDEKRILSSIQTYKDKFVKNIKKFNIFSLYLILKLFLKCLVVNFKPMC